MTLKYPIKQYRKSDFLIAKSLGINTSCSNLIISGMILKIKVTKNNIVSTKNMLSRNCIPLLCFYFGYIDLKFFVIWLNLKGLLNQR